MLEPRRIGAAEFKAHCLEIINEVDRLKTEVVITRHNRPMARLVPVEAPPGFCGSLAGMIKEEHDLISPIDLTWEYDESNLT